MSITADIQKLEPGGQVRLIEVDARNIGGDQLFFHRYLQQGPIWWQGQQYEAWPFEAEGFERTGDQPPTPTLRVANVNGMIGALCLLLDDMVGALVTVRRTLVKYLDAANFPDGNPTANPEEHFPDDIWYIERKAYEDKERIEFELSSATDFAGVQFPGRQIHAGMCGLIQRGGYRGPYCGYTGSLYFDIHDQPVADPALDVCSGTLTGCKNRFGPNNEIPYGGFPAAGLVRT